MTPPKGEAEILYLYGDPITDPMAFWRDHMRFCHLHPDIAAIPQLKHKHGFWVNKALVENIKLVFDKIREQGLLSEIKSFDGCQVTRMIRGGSKLSFHAFGAAIDLNASIFPLGKACDKVEVDCPKYYRVVTVFEEAGWTWGGRWHKRPDGMHFQYGQY